MTPCNDPAVGPADPAAGLTPSPTAVALPEGVWAADLATAARQELSWLWHGYLARGNVTLLTSRWKAGKTTLLSVLLARRVAGGSLAGRVLTAGRSAVVSEESPEHWEARRRRLEFGNSAWFLCRPFAGKPSLAQWLALIDRLAVMGARDGVDLAVIDSLSWFRPGRGENNADLMLEALAPLHRLTDCGLAVLLLHHPRKGEAPAGEAARGSGALSQFVDILVEMGCRDGGDRRRVLRGFSRFDETPYELVIELNAAGTDYAAVADALPGDFQDNWARLRAVLAAAPAKLARREIIGHWPDDGSAPADTTLRRWLQEAVGRGLLLCEGVGTRVSPLRYWLPEAEQRWQADPLYSLCEADRRAREELARRLPGGRPA